MFIILLSLIYMVLVKKDGYNVSNKVLYSNNKYNYFYNKGKIIYKRMKDINYIKRKLKFNILDNKDKIRYVKELINSYELS